MASASPIKHLVQAQADSSMRDLSIDQIVNVQIFGQDSTKIPPEQGITKVQVRSHDVGLIPGMSKHWDKEISNRVKEIKAYDKRSFVKRAMSIMKKNDDFERVNGLELAKMHPNSKSRDLVDRLKHNPADMMIRLELVTVIGRSGREISIEMARLLFIHALVACHFNEFTLTGLNIVLWIQNLYLSKLKDRIRLDQQSIQKHLDEAVRKNSMTGREAILGKYRDQMIVNISIIQSILDGTKRNLNAMTQSEVGIRRDEVIAFLLNDKKTIQNRDQQATEMVKRAFECYMVLRQIPMLIHTGQDLLNQIEKVKRNDPFTLFIRARLMMAELTYLVNQFRAGWQGEDMIKTIFQSFKATYHAYGMSVKYIGKRPRNATDHTILSEYVNLVHYFYKVTKTVIGRQPAKEWLKTAFKKAEETLELIPETAQTIDLRHRIMRDMSEEGFLKHSY